MPHYTPLSELPAQLDDENRLAWNIQLPPHIDAERLEVNTTRMARFGRIAGFSGISIEEYVGNKTTYEAPGIGGAFGDGTASAAGTAKASKADRQQTSLDDGHNCSLPTRMRWPLARISVNRPELTDKIVDRTSKGEDNHDAWAKELDGVLRLGLLHGAKKNLTPLGDGWNVGSDLIGYNQLILGVSTGSATWLMSYATVKGVLSAFHRYIYGAENFAKQRWSLSFYDLQLDRLAVAATYSSLQLIRAKK